MSEASDCPRLNVDLTQRKGVAGSHYEEIDTLRESHAAFWNEYGNGYWVLTRFEEIREAFQTPEVFTNQSISVTDPNPEYRFLPSLAEPPDHAKYRRPLNRWFSPKRVQAARGELERLADETVSEVIDLGSCDFMATYADRYPSKALALVLGMPQEAAPELLALTKGMPASVSVVGEKHTAVLDAMTGVKDYFAELLAARRAGRAARPDDFLNELESTRLDDRPLDDEEILDICMTTVLGALRTTRSQMGWCMWHFATHPEDRRRIVGDPTLIPAAVEEMLRAYPIVNMARKVAADTEFAGCPMKRDDMVLLMIQSANRDPRVFPDASTPIIDREPNGHITFGASPHRCLGSHVARAELQITLETWHRRIPDYEVDAQELMSSGGHIALLELPLRWSTTYG